MLSVQGVLTAPDLAAYSEAQVYEHTYAPSTHDSYLPPTGSTSPDLTPTHPTTLLTGRLLLCWPCLSECWKLPLAHRLPLYSAYPGVDAACVL